jgi:hypothetical protein
VSHSITSNDNDNFRVHEYSSFVVGSLYLINYGLMVESGFILNNIYAEDIGKYKYIEKDKTC